MFVSRLYPLTPSLLAASLVLATLPSHADETVAVLPNTEVDANLLALKERRESINPKQVIDGKELRRYGNGSLGDALRRMPGMHFGGPPGENKDLRLRGLDKEYSQVLVDGRRLPDSGEKRELQLDQIPMAMVDRVELIRSPSAEMDAQGIAGTLNIVLKKRSANTRQLILGAASGDQRPMDGSAQFIWGQADLQQQWLIGGGRQSRTIVKGKDKITSNAAGVQTAGEHEQETKRFFENYLTPHWGWQGENGDHLSLDLLLLDSEMHKDKEKFKFKAADVANGSEFEKEKMDSRNLGLSLAWEHPLGEHTQLDSHFSVRDLDDHKRKSKQSYKANGTVDKLETEDEQKTDREWQFGQSVSHWLGDEHELLGGYDLGLKKREKDKTKQSNSVASSEAKDRYQLEEKRLDLYLVDTWKLADNHRLKPGLRWEAAELDSEIPGSDADSREAHFAPSLHYRWDFASDWAMRSSVARTVRRPKFDDIIPSTESKSGTLADPNQIGNPDLEPEESIGYDLGVEHYFAEQRGLVGLNLFRRDIKNLMESVTFEQASDGEYYSQTQNTGDGKLWGAELEFNSELSWLGLDGLRSTASYSWLDSEVKDASTGEKRRFKQQPGYLASFGLEYLVPGTPLTVGGNWNKSGAYEDELSGSNGDSTKMDAIEYVDLFVNAELSAATTLRLAAENIGRAQKDQQKLSYNANGTLKNREDTREYSEPLYSMSVEIRW
ncbi:TonB-dependent receptor [Pseudomonas chengduensis]|nr:TonB-dependent receptor [Pseudomonas chengduensis]MBG0843723.1 TonB-dependent receptor [Pseudomonas chengduensis]